MRRAFRQSTASFARDLFIAALLFDTKCTGRYKIYRSIQKLLADTKTGEDFSEQIIGADGAGNFAERALAEA